MQPEDREITEHKDIFKMEKEQTNINQFIQWIGRDNYDALVKNGEIQRDILFKKLPFADLVPVVRIVAMSGHSDRETDHFFMMTALYQECYDDALIYGLHTFRSRLPELGSLKISQIMDYRQHPHRPLKMELTFVPETTVMGYFHSYAAKGTFYEWLPSCMWFQLNTSEENKRCSAK